MNNTLAPHPVSTPTVDPNFIIRNLRSWFYPHQIWWFLSLFIAIITISHLVTLLVHWRRKKRYSRSNSVEIIPLPVEDKERSIFRGLANVFRIVFFRTTVSIGGDSILNVAEICIICCYIAALLTWEFINSKNVTTGTKLDVKYWSDRAANIVATQLPLVIALTMKNNILSREIVPSFLD
ncbi:hypothetical protein Clacol_007968 [Clathrus columnatus]|uniref:Uncharacterized protein n=1 Tax=Clathrus columnatus TaxID=1419009 RepID=A0AAV5AGD8_9AGAM|nr:hypothetical protein Clacol_007968 [Clathrus columnatus]